VQGGLTTTQIRLNKVNRNRQSNKLSFSLHYKKKDNNGTERGENLEADRLANAGGGSHVVAFSRAVVAFPIPGTGKEIAPGY
jgi:hypothetical protein